MNRTWISTDQDVPMTYAPKILGATRLWGELMVKRGNLIEARTKTFGKVQCVWYPNKSRQLLTTITVWVSVEYGYTFEENWLVLLHGLTGLGYARATGFFQSQKSLTITVTKDNNMKQIALPVRLEYSR